MKFEDVERKTKLVVKEREQLEDRGLWKAPHMHVAYSYLCRHSKAKKRAGEGNSLPDVIGCVAAGLGKGLARSLSLRLLFPTTEHRHCGDGRCLASDLVMGNWKWGLDDVHAEFVDPRFLPWLLWLQTVVYRFFPTFSDLHPGSWTMPNLDQQYWINSLWNILLCEE